MIVDTRRLHPRGDDADNTAKRVLRPKLLDPLQDAFKVIDRRDGDLLPLACTPSIEPLLLILELSVHEPAYLAMKIEPKTKWNVSRKNDFVRLSIRTHKFELIE